MQVILRTYHHQLKLLIFSLLPKHKLLVSQFSLVFMLPLIVGLDNIFNAWCTWQQWLQYLVSVSVCPSVCLYVCLSPLILTLQAPNWLMSDTNSSSATSACGDFAKKMSLRMEKLASSRTMLLDQTINNKYCACV